LDTFVVDPLTNAELLTVLELNLRRLLVHGAFETDSGSNTVRYRAIQLFLQVVRSAKGAFRRIEGLHAVTPLLTWPDNDKPNIKRLAEVLDHAAKELYFASGAFNDRSQNNLPEQGGLTNNQRRRFYEETSSIFKELSDLGFPSTAHDRLQTLESFIPFDPRTVFLRVGDIVRAAVGGGYQFEQMAADLVVRMVSVVWPSIVNYSKRVRKSRQVLVELQDIFIRAGWSSARQLTYRLEQIFR